MQGRQSYLELRSGSHFSSYRFPGDFLYVLLAQWPEVQTWMTFHITVRLPRMSVHKNSSGLVACIFIFSCPGIVTNMVLSFPCSVKSAGKGGLLGCFTQTLASITCISFVDPNPPSPLLVRRNILLFVLCQLHVEE